LLLFFVCLFFAFEEIVLVHRILCSPDRAKSKSRAVELSLTLAMKGLGKRL
jgi:hypothetical protein